MITRLYIHNYRCFENFDLLLGSFRSVLLLGRNGAGKTTVGAALELLQKIARGSNRVRELLGPGDVTAGHPETPVRFEIEATIEGCNFAYSVVFEFPKGFRELRVFEERLLVDGEPIFTRELAQVRLARNGQDSEAAFRLDWHQVALPIVQEQTRHDPLAIFKNWLRRVLIIRPVPHLLRGTSDINSLELDVPDVQLRNVGNWFSNMVAASPATYSTVKDYLMELMPDFVSITNQAVGREARILGFHFSKGQQNIELGLEELSDGEKCFVVAALAIATNSAYGPVTCFWDEPENFLAPDEVGQTVMALRRAFQDSGQLIVTSHNPEAIRRFSEANTLYFSRKSHLEPTVVRVVEAMRVSGQYEGGFVDALLRGDVEA